jgi:hypothetical protein
MTTHRPLSYDLIQSRSTGAPITRARVTCSTCGAHEEITITANGNSPPLVTQKITAAGWSFDAHTARKNTCPECLRKRRDRAAGEKPRLENSTMIDQNQALHAIQIFKKLETVFVKGRFLPGWSDERVGKECGGLSKAFVTTIRESQFGPIKGTAEVAALRSEHDTLKGMVEAFGARLASLEKTIGAE